MKLFKTRIIQREHTTEKKRSDVFIGDFITNERGYYGCIGDDNVPYNPLGGFNVLISLIDELEFCPVNIDLNKFRVTRQEIIK